MTAQLSRSAPSVTPPTPPTDDILGDFEKSIANAVGPAAPVNAERWSIQAIGQKLWIRADISPASRPGFDARALLDTQQPFALTIDAGRVGESCLQLRQAGNVVALAIADRINDPAGHRLLIAMADAIEARVQDLVTATAAKVDSSPATSSLPPSAGSATRSKHTDDTDPKGRSLAIIGWSIPVVAAVVLLVSVFGFGPQDSRSVGDERFVPLIDRGTITDLPFFPYVKPDEGSDGTPAPPFEPDPRFTPLD